MSPSRHASDPRVLVRFWSLDHHRAEPVLWTESPWTKLVFAAEGTLLVETEREHHVLPPNRAMLIAPNQPHPSRTAGKARVRTLYFAPQLRLDLSKRVFEVRPLLRELIDEACRIGPLTTDGRMHRELASLIVSEVHDAPTHPSSILMPRTAWAKDWAEAFLSDPSEAQDPPCSQRTLERAIQRETGLTLGQWRQQARAMVGLRTLSEGATVLEAAMAVGFETTSGFIQSFRRQFGTTPGRILRH